MMQAALLVANGMDVLYILTGQRHENVARGNVETALLQRFRLLDTVGQYAVVKLLAALCGQDTPPQGWSSCARGGEAGSQVIHSNTGTVAGGDIHYHK